MYTGDDLTNFWGLVAMGAAIGLTGMTLSHRAYKRGCYVAGGLFIASGFLWGPIKRAVPAAGPFITEITSRPTNWFLLLLLLLVALWLHQWRKELMAGLAIPPATPADGISDAAQVQAFKNALAATNARFDSWKDELCERIQSGADYRDKQDKALFESLEKIQKQIAVGDLPNASTVVEAFKNLDTAVHLKIARIGEQIQGYSDRVRKDNLALLHLLYFATQQATEGQLVHLLSLAPTAGENENSDLNPKAYKKNSAFLDEVGRGLSGSQRYSSFQNILRNGEGESERRLKELPPSLWTEGVNPIDLRRYFIAAFTRQLVVDYLEHELMEIRDAIRSARSEMMAQYQEREKEGRSN